VEFVDRLHEVLKGATETVDAPYGDQVELAASSSLQERIEGGAF
jgi:hypothetical protein